tara:strand:- start:2222 stop:2752 length:531 start_codon:yes stop_codon:yes gene_type:complete
MNITNQIVLEDESALDIFPKDVLGILTKKTSDELWGYENEIIFIDMENISIHFGYNITSSICQILEISEDEFINLSNGLYKAMQKMKGRAKPFEVMYYEDLGSGETCIYYYKYNGEIIEGYVENDYDLGFALYGESENIDEKINMFTDDVLSSMDNEEIPQILLEAFSKVKPRWIK